LTRLSRARPRPAASPDHQPLEAEARHGRCADPHGYFAQILARVTAAGDNAASASGLSALLLAAVPLQGVPTLEKKLTAELNRTVGLKH
jgi:hypothetical protein